MQVDLNTSMTTVRIQHLFWLRKFSPRGIISVNAIHASMHARTQTNVTFKLFLRHLPVVEEVSLKSQVNVLFVTDITIRALKKNLLL